MATKFTEWTGSPQEGTAGLEGEVYLIDANTGHLVPAALRLIKLIWSKPRYAPLRMVVTPEYYACMIELKTPNGGLMPARVPPAYSSLLTLLMEAAEECGLGLLTAAHYLGSDDMWRNQPLFEDPNPGGIFHENGRRYQRLRKRIPQIQRQPRIPGNISMQPHAGLRMGTAEEKQLAVTVCDTLTTATPTLAAIGANSPDPANPNVDSQRLQFWLQLPRAGVRLFHTFDNLLAHAADLKARGEISQPTEMWYAVRLNQQTVEVRCIDMQPTVDRLLSMQAFVHCLAMAVCYHVRAGGQIYLPPIEELTAIDLWTQSLQRSAQVPFWDFQLGRWLTLDQRLEWLIDFARSGIGLSGQGPLLDHFASWALARDNGAALMRQLFAAHATPENTYLAAADAFEDSLEFAIVA